MMHIRSVDSMVTKNRAKTKGKKERLKIEQSYFPETTWTSLLQRCRQIRLQESAF